MSESRAPIYVVDDDASVREAVGSLVRSAGFRAETFASAQEFLTSPRDDGPSCLVLDVELPGLSGLDLQQELVKSDTQIPIIFLTARTGALDVIEGINAGARHYITKPFNMRDLLDKVAKAIK